MKKGFKMLFASLAVFLGMGAAGVASMTAVKEADTKAVEAGNNQEETHVFYVAVANSVLSSYTNPEVRVNCNIGDGGTWRQTTGTNLGDTTTYSGYTVFYATYTEKYGGTDAMQVQIYVGSTWKEQVVINGSWSTTVHTGKTLLYKVGTGSTSRAFEWKDDSYTPPLTEYTITKLAVEFVNGVAQSPADWDLGNDTVLDGATYSVPGSVTKNLEHFVGWYTNAACTTAYTSRTITSNLTIYAKFERLSLDSYFYWTDKESTDMTHIYFFGEYAPVGWPGTTLSTYLVSTVMYFNGEGKLYRIPVPSSGSFQFVLNNNNNVKTGDTSVTQEACLYTAFDNEYEGTYWYRTNWSSTAGVAADVAYLLETKRNDVTAGGGTAAYSICGISTSDANAILAAYNGLDSGQKSMVDATYTYTYDGADTSKQVNVNFSDIMVQLAKNVAGKGALQSIFLNTTDSSTSIIVVISALLLAGAAIGGYFLLRKKRVHH